MSDRIKVCLILEGTYPFITGGVSAWVQDLITGIPDVDFILYSLSPEKNQKVKYKLPPNVILHKDVVISDKTINKKKLKDKVKLLTHIALNHKKMFSSQDDFDKMISLFKPEVSLSKQAVTSKIGWDIISENNMKNNPIYPFKDYFWAWRSSHEMIFNIISSLMPEADLYHSISTGYAGLAGITAKIRNGKPFMLSEHGLYHKEREIEIRRSRFFIGYQRDMWIKIYKRLSVLSYKYADMTTSLFESARQVQIELGSDVNRSIVIPNGIDIERFESIKKEKRKGFHVGLIGRVVPIKDIKTFITTAKITSESIPDAKFYCIGPTDEDEAYFNECKSLVASLKIEDKFIFTGSADVREYYSFLDVLVLTSIREAQPLVILEAFSASVPVVSTKVGNVPEMLDFDDRFIAASKDSAKIAEGLIYIHSHPEIMKTLIQQNKEKVRKYYDKKDLHKKFYDLYKALV